MKILICLTTIKKKVSNIHISNEINFTTIIINSGTGIIMEWVTDNPGFGYPQRHEEMGGNFFNTDLRKIQL